MRLPSRNHINSANAGAAASAAPKSEPQGGATMMSTVTPKNPIAPIVSLRLAPFVTSARHTTSPTSRTLAAASCANVRFPSPDTRIPTVAE